MYSTGRSFFEFYYSCDPNSGVKGVDKANQIVERIKNDMPSGCKIVREDIPYNHYIKLQVSVVRK